ncbi:MAG: 30S ribosome-binding factor RbfA [Rhodocyclaceae bacterium]|nr:30S ribosome-binding factor RbfA [Rhodocyclaceae bacterium]MBK9625435.1 30S ribosome-binding factor RbfA [Rhodocyclaceae bacterium]MBL0076412.1 30S ribosome-binding factor RbfA [Rhodocyclaceae bacterium]MBP6109257.1 30S ribosome-binding factor RbfA [Rhodocyclaceae bacterium]MBP6278728.1 30S ribosome-binding factor RbfA [Rhodocyclaceae bacterium]
MATKQGFARSDRISEQIRRELADLIRFGLKDPRLSSHLALVTITDVETTRDYSHAKIFFTSLSPSAAKEEITEGLKRSAGFLRRELGKRIRLHKIPELHFVFDASVEYGSRLSRLIDDAVESDAERGGEPQQE